MRRKHTLPGGARLGKFDSSYEEILPLITSAGYAYAYPDVFGEKLGTDIANAMDKARGGRFQRVPRKYPSNAWFSYDDRSCDYSCQITEYIYWVGYYFHLRCSEFSWSAGGYFPRMETKHRG